MVGLIGTISGGNIGRGNPNPTQPNPTQPNLASTLLSEGFLPAFEYFRRLRTDSEKVGVVSGILYGLEVVGLSA